MSTDERRALALILSLIALAAGARWVERPQPVLADVEALDLDALEQASRDARPAPRARGAPAAPLDPNTATAAQLASLPGVGPALAGRIVEERERGPFRSLDDLRRVRGIGPALAQSLAGHVTLPVASGVPESRVAQGLTPLGPALRSTPERGADGPIDINTASSTDLQKVSGVGPVLAARIIARRDSLGRFSGWEQVDAVSGVGPAVLSRLRESVVIRP